MSPRINNQKYVYLIGKEWEIIDVSTKIHKITKKLSDNYCAFDLGTIKGWKVNISDINDNWSGIVLTTLELYMLGGEPNEL